MTDLASSFGCKQCKVESYLDLLAAISDEKKSITDLSHVIGRTPSNASRMVTVLQKKGLVRRVFAGTIRYVVLTEKGKEILMGAGE